MRILSVCALCLAGAVSLPATGQSTPSAAQPAPAKNAPNVSTQAAAQKVATANTPVQTGSQQDGTGQNAQAGTPDAQLNRWLALGQTTPAPRTGTKRSLPQISFDRGIYAGRDVMAGSVGCLAIQSYNFSETAPGKMPKLESVTTCTPATQPLMRNARKPGSQNQPGQVIRQEVNQPDQEKDKK